MAESSPLVHLSRYARRAFCPECGSIFHHERRQAGAGCHWRTVAFPDVAPGEKLAQAGPVRPGPAPARADAKMLPPVTDLLAAAVTGIGGAERPGQVEMAEAVERSLRSGEHLAVQAGTGTGKSLAYLVP